MRYFHRHRRVEEIESGTAGLAVLERQVLELFLGAQQSRIVGGIKFADCDDAVIARVQNVTLEVKMLSEQVAQIVSHARRTIEALSGMLAQADLIQKTVGRGSRLDCVRSAELFHSQRPLFGALEEAARLVGVERLPKWIDLGYGLGLRRKRWIGNHHRRMEGVDRIA